MRSGRLKERDARILPLCPEASGVRWTAGGRNMPRNGSLFQIISSRNQQFGVCNRGAARCRRFRRLKFLLGEPSYLTPTPVESFLSLHKRKKGYPFQAALFSAKFFGLRAYLLTFFDEVRRNGCLVNIFFENLRDHRQGQRTCFLDTRNFLSLCVNGMTSVFLVPLAQRCRLMHLLDDLPPTDSGVVCGRTRSHLPEYRTE